MRTQIQTVVAFMATLTTQGLADSDVAASATDTKKIVQNNFVETAQKGVKLSGYVDAGYSYNFTGSGNQSMVATRYATDTAQRGDFNLYALKLALEKAMTSENKAQAGFRADVMIGEDASYFVNRTPNAGYNTNNNSNTLFLEQAYASVRAPVGNGWDFQIGKFVSTMGYEVIERPANLNVTYGILFNVMPLYYTGVLSSYRFDDSLDAKLGVVNGSNSDNNTTLNPNAGDGVALLASLSVTAPGGNANWSNNFQYSTGYDNNTSTGATNSSLTSSSQPARANNGNISAYMLLYNSWGNWSPKFADDKLLLAFNTVFGNLSGVAADGPANINTHWYGAGAYAKYQLNDWFSLSSRGEYLGSNNDGVLGYIGASTTHNTPEPNNPTRHVTGVNFWEYTLTASFNVIENVLIRAEYRMDWGANLYQVSSGAAQPEGANGPAYYAGAEVVYSF